MQFFIQKKISQHNKLRCDTRYFHVLKKSYSLCKMYIEEYTNVPSSLSSNFTNGSH